MAALASRVPPFSYLLLKELGFDVEARLGGLLFRAGPDPGLDCVTFCDETNHGRVRDGRLIGHALGC
jgi:hypothetical protein